ncbi:hypothetical protein NDU88_000023 [Pleurodeles waltl]|uniref:Uncharacterized protein n=1 Tax=Pleurodeles waltl TaxID=8319 RepID=A0AAV7SVU2_PLEWA|nr:hypothetical protein NDU88_000023 [Pleurodeles waltl]
MTRLRKGQCPQQCTLPSERTTRLPKGHCPQQRSAPVRASNKDPKGPVPTTTQRSRQSKQGSQRASAHSNAGLPSERTTRLPKGQCPQQCSAPIRAKNNAPKGPVPTAVHAPTRANNKDPKRPVPTATQGSRQSKQQGSQRASAHSNAGLPSEQTTRIPKGQCPQQHSTPIRANNKDPKGPVPTAAQRSRQSKQGSQRVSAHSNAALPSEQTRLPKGQCPQQRWAPIRGNNKAPKGPVPTATQGSRQSKQGSQRASAHSNAALPSERTTRLPKGQCPQQRSAPIRANNKDPKGPVPTATQGSRQSEQQGSQRFGPHSNTALPSEQTRLPKGQCPQQRSAPVRENNKAPKGSVPTATQRSRQRKQQGSQRVSAHSNAALPSEKTTRLPKDHCPQQHRCAPIRANNRAPKGPVPIATYFFCQNERQGSQRASAHSNPAFLSESEQQGSQTTSAHNSAAALPSELTTRLPKGHCPQKRSAPVRAYDKAPKGPVPIATQQCSRQSEQQGSQRASAHSNAACLPRFFLWGSRRHDLESRFEGV